MQYFKTVRFLVLTFFSVLFLGCSQLPTDSMIEPLKLYGLNENPAHGKDSWIAGIRQASGGVYVDIAVLISEESKNRATSNEIIRTGYYPIISLTFQARKVSLGEVNEMWVQIRAVDGSEIRLRSTRRQRTLTPFDLDFLNPLRHFLSRVTIAPNLHHITRREGEPDLLIQNLSFRCTPEINSGVYEARFTKSWQDWCGPNLGVDADDEWRTFVID